jgi:hypothetical protein
MENLTSPQVVFLDKADPDDVNLMEAFYEAAKDIEFEHLLSIMRIAEEHRGAIVDAGVISLHREQYEPVLSLWSQISESSRRADRSVDKQDPTTSEQIKNDAEHVRLQAEITDIQERADNTPVAIARRKTEPGYRAKPKAIDQARIESIRRQMERIRHAKIAGRFALRQVIDSQQNHKIPA